MAPLETGCNSGEDSTWRAGNSPHLIKIRPQRAQRDRMIGCNIAVRIACREKGSPTAMSAHLPENDFQHLPAIVGRYLTYALGTSRTPAGHVQLEQRGELRRTTRSRWMRFEATQWITPEAMSFVWNARIYLFGHPFLEVTDRLLNGEGSGSVRFRSLIVLASQGGDRRIDLANTQRLLAEAVWYPAFLASSAVTWAHVSDRCARASIDVDGVNASVDFHFDDDAVVVKISSGGRWRRVGTEYQLYAWEARVGAYQRLKGIAIPAEAQVGWYEHDEWQCVWRAGVRPVV